MNQSDLNNEVILHRIGTCPVCGKGRMLQGTAGWTCDYFRSISDKCTFTIFGSYNGYELTEDDAVALITDGETDIKTFHTMEGKPFEAILKRVEDKIKVVGENALLDTPCPICGGKVKETQKGYACEGFFRDGEEHCKFWVHKEICGRFITADEVRELCEKGHTEVLDGFQAQGKEFSSCLVLSPGGDPILDGEICICPKCGGKVYAGIKAYNCSNYRNPGIRCNFVVWRILAGHRMTVEEVCGLCNNRQTPLMQFFSREGKPYERHLIINEQGNVVMV